MLFTNFPYRVQKHTTHTMHRSVFHNSIDKINPIDYKHGYGELFSVRLANARSSSGMQVLIAGKQAEIILVS